MSIDWSSMPIPGLGQTPPPPMHPEKRSVDASLPEIGDASKRIKVEEAVPVTVPEQSNESTMEVDGATGLIGEELPTPEPVASSGFQATSSTLSQIYG